MAGVTHEAGNTHSSRTPGSSSYPKVLYCVGCTVTMIISQLLSCTIRLIRQIIGSDWSAGTLLFYNSTHINQ